MVRFGGPPPIRMHPLSHGDDPGGPGGLNFRFKIPLSPLHLLIPLLAILFANGISLNSLVEASWPTRGQTFAPQSQGPIETKVSGCRVISDSKVFSLSCADNEFIMNPSYSCMATDRPRGDSHSASWAGPVSLQKYEVACRDNHENAQDDIAPVQISITCCPLPDAFHTPQFSQCSFHDTHALKDPLYSNGTSVGLIECPSGDIAIVGGSECAGDINDLINMHYAYSGKLILSTNQFGFPSYALGNPAASFTDTQPSAWQVGCWNWAVSTTVYEFPYYATSICCTPSSTYRGGVSQYTSMGSPPSAKDPVIFSAAPGLHSSCPPFDLPYAVSYQAGESLFGGSLVGTVSNLYDQTINQFILEFQVNKQEGALLSLTKDEVLVRGYDFQVRCLDMDCPIQPANSIISVLSSNQHPLSASGISIPMETEVIYSCPSGYSFEGLSDAALLADINNPRRTLSVTTTCKGTTPTTFSPYVLPPGCFLNVALPANGTIRTSFRQNSIDDVYLTLTCQDGYYPVGGPGMFARDVRSSTDLSCVRSACPTPTYRYPHGQAVITASDKYEIVCDEDYVFQRPGAAKFQCNNAEWQPTDSHDKDGDGGGDPVQCIEPVVRPNLTLTYVYGNPYAIRATWPFNDGDTAYDLTYKLIGPINDAYLTRTADPFYGGILGTTTFHIKSVNRSNEFVIETDRNHQLEHIEATVKLTPYSNYLNADGTTSSIARNSSGHIRVIEAVGCDPDNPNGQPQILSIVQTYAYGQDELRINWLPTSLIARAYRFIGKSTVNGYPDPPSVTVPISNMAENLETCSNFEPITTTIQSVLPGQGHGIFYTFTIKPLISIIAQGSSVFDKSDAYITLTNPGPSSFIYNLTTPNGPLPGSNSPGSNSSLPPQDGRGITFQVQPVFWFDVSGFVTSDASIASPVSTGIANVNVTIQLVDQDQQPLPFCFLGSSCYIIVETDAHGVYSARLQTNLVNSSIAYVMVTPSRMDVLPNLTFSHNFTSSVGAFTHFYFGDVSHSELLTNVNFKDTSVVSLTGNVQLSTPLAGLNECPVGNIIVFVYLASDSSLSNPVAISEPTLDTDGSFEIVVPPFGQYILKPFSNGRIFKPPVFPYEVRGRSNENSIIFKDITTAKLTIEFTGGDCQLPTGDVFARLIFPSCMGATNGKGVAGFEGIPFPTTAPGGITVPAVNYRLDPSALSSNGLEYGLIEPPWDNNLKEKTAIQTFLADPDQQRDVLLFSPVSSNVTIDYRYNAATTITSTWPIIAIQDRFANQPFAAAVISGAFDAVKLQLHANYGPDGKGICGNISVAVDFMDQVSEDTTSCTLIDGAKSLPSGACQLKSVYNETTKTTHVNYPYRAGSVVADPSDQTIQHDRPSYSRRIEYQLSGAQTSANSLQFVDIVITGVHAYEGGNVIIYPPVAPLFILRRPPGDSSFASIVAGSTISHPDITISDETASLKGKWSNTQGVKSDATLCTGIGTSVCKNLLEQAALTGFSFEIGATFASHTERDNSRSTTFTETVTTSQDPSLTGNSADLFLTVSGTAITQDTFIVSLRNNTFGGKYLEAFGYPHSSYTLSPDNTLIWSTPNDMLNVLIPKLEHENANLVFKNTTFPDTFTAEDQTEYDRNKGGIQGWKNLIQFNIHLIETAGVHPDFVDDLASVNGIITGNNKTPLQTAGSSSAALSQQDLDTILQGVADQVATQNQFGTITFLGGGLSSGGSPSILQFDITTDVTRSYEVTLTGGNEEGFHNDFDFELETVAATATDWKFEIDGNNQWSVGRTFSPTGNTEVSNTVSVVLADSNLGDVYQVQIRADHVFGSPVYWTIGGQSRCPHEEGTQPREFVQLSIDHTAYVHQDPRVPISALLRLVNGSPTHEDFSYALSIDPGTNLGGLVLSIGGTVLNSDTSTVVYTSIYGGSQSIVMLITRSPGSPYTFEQIQVIASGIGNGANCNSSTVTLSVEYDQPCNQVEFVGRLAIENTFIVNQANKLGNSFQFGLDVELGNPEVNIYGRDWTTNANQGFLQHIRLQYQDITTGPNGQWNNIKPVIKSECVDGTDYDVLCPLSYLSAAADSGDIAAFKGDFTGLMDGLYQLRAVAKCKVPVGVADASPYTHYSKPITGRVDTHPPQVFGTPNPTGQVYFPGMDISVPFTESINCATVGAPLKFIAWVNPGQNEMNLLDTYYQPPIRAKCTDDTVQFQFMSPQWDLMVGHAVTFEVSQVYDLAGNTQPIPIRFTFQIGIFDVERSILHINNLPSVGNYSSLISSLTLPSTFSSSTIGSRRLLGSGDQSVIQFQNEMVDELVLLVNSASKSTSGTLAYPTIIPSQISITGVHSSSAVVFTDVRIMPLIAPNGTSMSPTEFGTIFEGLLQSNFSQRCQTLGLSVLSTIPTNVDGAADFINVELQPFVDYSNITSTGSASSGSAAVIINSDGSLLQVNTSHSIQGSSVTSSQFPGADVVTLSFNVTSGITFLVSNSSLSYYTVYDTSKIDYDFLARMNPIVPTYVDLTDSTLVSIQQHLNQVQVYVFNVPTQPGGTVLNFMIQYSDAKQVRQQLSENIFIVGPPLAPMIQSVNQVAPALFEIDATADVTGVTLDSSSAHVQYVISVTDSVLNPNAKLIALPSSWISVLSSTTLRVNLSLASTVGLTLPSPGVTNEWRLGLQSSTVYGTSSFSYTNFSLIGIPSSVEIDRIVPASDYVIGSYRVYFNLPMNSNVTFTVGYQSSVLGQPTYDLVASNSISSYDINLAYTTVPVHVPSSSFGSSTVYFFVIATDAVGSSSPVLHAYTTPFILPPGQVTVYELSSPSNQSPTLIQSDNLRVNVSWLPTNQSAIQPESDLFLGYRISIVSLNPTFNVSYEQLTVNNILSWEFVDISVMGLPYVVAVQSLMNSSRNLAIAQRSDGTGIQILASGKSEAMIQGDHVVSIDSIMQLSNDSIMITLQPLDAHINQYQAVMLKSGDSTFVPPANQYLDMTKNTIVVSGLPLSESGQAQLLVFAVHGRMSVGWSRLSVPYQFYLLSLQHQVKQSVMQYNLVGPKQLNITYASGVTNRNGTIVSIYWPSNNTETLDIVFRQEPFYLTDNLDEISMNGDLPIRQFHSDDTSGQFQIRYIPSLDIRVLTIFDLPVQAGGSFYYLHVSSRMHTFQFSQTVFVTGSPTPSMVLSVNQISLSQVNVVYVPTRFSGLVNSHENLFGCAVSEYGTYDESTFVQMRLINSVADYVIVPIMATTHSSANSTLQFTLPSMLLPLPGESLVYDVCLITSTPVANVSSICLPVTFNTVPKSVTFVLTEQLGLDLFRLDFKTPLDASQSIHTYQGGFSYDGITMVQDPFVNHTVPDWNGVNASIVIRIDPVPIKPTHMIYLFLRSINKFGASEFHRHAVYPSWLSSPTIIDIGQVKLFDHSESGGNSVSVVLTWLPPTLVYPRPGLFIGYDIIVEPARLVPGNSEGRIHLQVGSNISTVTISGLNPSISDYTALIVGRMQSTGNCIQRLFGLRTIISQPDIHSFALLPPPNVVFINSTLQTGPTDIRLTFQPVDTAVGPIQIYRAAVVSAVAPYITYPLQTLDLVTNSILISGLQLCSTGSICSIVVLIQAFNIGGWSSTQPSVRRVVNYFGRPNAPFIQDQYQVISTSTTNGRVALLLEFQDQVLESVVTVTFTPDGSNSAPLVFNLTVLGTDPVYYHEFDLPVILGGVWYTCTVTASNVVGMSDANREKLFVSNPFPAFPLPPNCCQSRLFSDTTSTMSFILPTSYQDEHYVLTHNNPIVDTAFTGTLEQALRIYADPNKKECIVVQLEGVRINSSHSPSISSAPFSSITQTDGKSVLLSDVFKMNKATEITFHENHDDKHLTTFLEQLNNVRYHVDIKCTTPSGIEHQPAIVSFTCFEFSTTISGRVTETVLSSPLLRSEPSICQPMVLPLDAVWPTRPMQQYNSTLQRRFTVANIPPAVPIETDPAELSIELSVLLESNSTALIDSNITQINPIKTHLIDFAPTMPVELLTNETLHYPGTDYLFPRGVDATDVPELVIPDGLAQRSSSSTAPSESISSTSSISTARAGDMSSTMVAADDNSSSTGGTELPELNSSSTLATVSSTQPSLSAIDGATSLTVSVPISSISSTVVSSTLSSTGSISSSGAHTVESTGTYLTGIFSSSQVSSTGIKSSSTGATNINQPLWWSRSWQREAAPVGATFPCTLNKVDLALVNDTDAFGSTLAAELSQFMNVSPERFTVTVVKKLAKSTAGKSVVRGQNKAAAVSSIDPSSSTTTGSVEATVVALPSNVNTTDADNLALSLQTILSTLTTDADMTNALESTGFSFKLLQAGVTIGTIQLQPVQACSDGIIRLFCTNTSATLLINDDSPATITSVPLTSVINDRSGSGVDIPSGLFISLSIFALIGIVGLVVLGVWYVRYCLVERRKRTVADVPLDEKTQPHLIHHPTDNIDLVVNPPKVDGEIINECGTVIQPSDTNVRVGYVAQGIGHLILSPRSTADAAVTTLYTNASTPRTTNTTSTVELPNSPIHSRHHQPHISTDPTDEIVVGLDITIKSDSEVATSSDAMTDSSLEPIGSVLEQESFTPILPPSTVSTPSPSHRLMPVSYGQLPTRHQLSHRFFATFSPTSSNENTGTHIYQPNTNTTS